MCVCDRDGSPTFSLQSSDLGRDILAGSPGSVPHGSL